MVDAGWIRGPLPLPAKLAPAYPARGKFLLDPTEGRLAAQLALNRILIAWKNTAEARKAVAAAPPLLQQYKVMASASAEPCAGDVGGYLDAIAGAYRHSRLREWAFGGVTRHLLQQGPTCALLMH